MKGLRLTGLLFAAAALGACGENVRTPLDGLGLFEAPQAPDPFMVMTRAPLRMPSSAALPEPVPGERSPLEPTPLIDAQVALIGRPAAGSAAVTSPGEQALLASANAAAAPADIRTTLVADLENPDEAYTPPSLFDLFFGDDAVAEGEIVDPEAEARRLMASGAQVPVDPNAVAEEEDTPTLTVDEDNPDLFPTIQRTGTTQRAPTSTQP